MWTGGPSQLAQDRKENCRCMRRDILRRHILFTQFSLKSRLPVGTWADGEEEEEEEEEEEGLFETEIVMIAVKYF